MAVWQNQLWLYGKSVLLEQQSKHGSTAAQLQAEQEQLLRVLGTSPQKVTG